MKKSLISFIICVSSVFLCNNTPAQILHFSNEYFIWNDTIPGPVPENYPDEKWTQGDESEYGLVQYVSHPTIRVFLPEKELNTGTAIIVCPGGGYNILVIEREGYKIARALNKLGIAAMVLKYRHYDTDIAVLDAWRALQFVRANADKWDIDPDKVGIGGFSAGGHLSLNTVLSSGSIKLPHLPDDILQNYSHQSNFLMLIYPGLGRFSLEPETFKGKIPPVFMINAIDDDVTPVLNVFKLTEILESIKNPAEVHIYPGGGHGFDLGNKDCNCSGWPDLFRDWLIFNRFINDD
jgi:acetyl esterase/lipase